MGDADAFAAIYRELAPKVVGYLRARGVDDPDGLTSEVFLTVLPRLPKLAGGVAGLRTFVFSVAHARFVDDVRRRQREPQLTEYDAALDERVETSAEVGAIESLDTLNVLRLLEFLNAEQRAVLALRVVADLTLEQVAEVMGKSSGAVKQLQRRGLIRLKELVKTPDVTP